MTAELRDRQAQRCCDALAAVGPDAPTACEGWTAWDLALHLWALKHDPPSWPGIAIPALARVTARRAERVKARWPYAHLVERLRYDPGRIAVMPLDALQGHRHALGEYYIHTQDVVRVNGLEVDRPDDALEEALWRRAQEAAPVLHRRRTPGLVLVRPDGVFAQVTSGDPRTTVHGLPSEILCWLYGRPARVDVVT